jgi:glycogen operon protein
VLQSAQDDIAWLRPDGHPMTDADWAAGYARAIAVMLTGDGPPTLLLVNAWWEPLTFTLPDAGPWSVLVDTADSGTADGARVELDGRSLMLVSRPR